MLKTVKYSCAAWMVVNPKMSAKSPFIEQGTLSQFSQKKEALKEAVFR